MVYNMYQVQPEDFYSRELKVRGVKNIWNWHKKRNRIIGQIVNKYFSEGIVMDLGCGNSLWNTNNIPTIGVDICESMLKYNSKRDRDFLPLKANILDILPLKDNSIDCIVITEVLEHIEDHSLLIKEIERVLKPKGFVIGSVPYARFPGLWNFLFIPWCMIKGLLFNNRYYLNLCGHKVNFSILRLNNLFSGWINMEIKTLNLLTIFFAFKNDKDV